MSVCVCACVCTSVCVCVFVVSFRAKIYFLTFIWYAKGPHRQVIHCETQLLANINRHEDNCILKGQAEREGGEACLSTDETSSRVIRFPNS